MVNTLTPLLIFAIFATLTVIPAAIMLLSVSVAIWKVEFTYFYIIKSVFRTVLFITMVKHLITLA
jgi:hypothetical protein